MSDATCEEYRATVNAYVVGFLFVGTGSDQRVVLIRKDKPDWQRGFLNGVGGKIEPIETPAEAMVREFHEETGEMRTDWAHFLQINFKGAVVHFFRAFCQSTEAKTTESEMVVRASLGSLPGGFVTAYYGKGSEVMLMPVITNLRWIIPMALSGETGSMLQ